MFYKARRVSLFLKLVRKALLHVLHGEKQHQNKNDTKGASTRTKKKKELY